MILLNRYFCFWDLTLIKTVRELRQDWMLVMSLLDVLVTPNSWPTKEKAAQQSLSNVKLTNFKDMETSNFPRELAGNLTLFTGTTSEVSLYLKRGERGEEPSNKDGTRRLLDGSLNKELNPGLDFERIMLSLDQMLQCVCYTIVFAIEPHRRLAKLLSSLLINSITRI